MRQQLLSEAGSFRQLLILDAQKAMSWCLKRAPNFYKVSSFPPGSCVMVRAHPRSSFAHRAPLLLPQGTCLATPSQGGRYVWPHLVGQGSSGLSRRLQATASQHVRHRSMLCLL